MKYLKTEFVVVFVLAAILAGNAYSYPQGTQTETLTGPWELSVQAQHGTNGISFPISVEDENKPGTLKGNLPIAGKPMRVQLQEYLPDLQWETNIAHKDNGGIIAEMHITGNGLDRKLFLDSEDDKKKSITATGIGSLSVHKFYDKSLVKKIADQIADPKALGIISVWLKGSDQPVEFLATETGTLIVPATNYRITIQQYVPHYSIDTDTRQVVSISDKPVNPAIKIKTEIDGEAAEQWLWSKFPSHPHGGTELPFRIEYFAFKLGAKGDHLLAGAKGSQVYIFYIKDGQTVAEKAQIDKPYFFKDKTYSFRLMKIRQQAAIETKWSNKSESLKNPAIIASIVQNGHQRQAVLELNKAYNAQTETGMLTILFRKQQNNRKYGTSQY